VLRRSCVLGPARRPMFAAIVGGFATLGNTGKHVECKD
jgi:hypothetical protein